MTELPSAKLIAEGKCPGYQRSYVGGETGTYATDAKYPVRGCGNKITRGDLCGTHDNIRKKAVTEAEVWLARKAERMERERKVGIATNLSMLLADKYGVPFGTDSDGQVTLTIKDAERLLKLP